MVLAEIDPIEEQMPDDHAGKAKFTNIDIATGETVEEWLAKEEPEPEPEQPPSISDRLAALEKAFAAHIKGQDV